MGRDLFKPRCDRGQNLKILLHALTADPANEPRLKVRAQPPCPLRGRQGRLAGCRGRRLRLAIGFQIQQQQRAFRQQRTAAHGPQVIEQRQQYQRQIPPAGQHALEVARQLHHGAHQRIERLILIFALIPKADQIAGDLLHFLGEQRGAIDLQHPQRQRSSIATLSGCSTCCSSATRPSPSAVPISRATLCRVWVASSVMLHVQWLMRAAQEPPRALILEKAPDATAPPAPSRMLCRSPGRRR